MKSIFYVRAAAAVFTACLSVSIAFAQANNAPKYESQEYSEVDGVPVLIKHLPQWESMKASTVLVHDVPALKAALGDRAVFDQIDFTAGTEAASAKYASGTLLVVEFASPQGSIDADNRIKAVLDSTGDKSTVYKRIGNYNVFVFDGPDPAAAGALADLVKYEKDIQWLGDNPFHMSAERAFVLTTSNIFFSTVMVILIGIGVAIVGGLVSGSLFFMSRERRRASMATFTDAGGMTRLNLDGFTPEIVPDPDLGD